jgi:hypothetical protein
VGAGDGPVAARLAGNGDVQSSVGGPACLLTVEGVGEPEVGGGGLEGNHHRGLGQQIRPRNMCSLPGFLMREKNDSTAGRSRAIVELREAIGDLEWHITKVLADRERPRLEMPYLLGFLDHLRERASAFDEQDLRRLDRNNLTLNSFLTVAVPIVFSGLVGFATRSKVQEASEQRPDWKKLGVIFDTLYGRNESSQSSSQTCSPGGRRVLDRCPTCARERVCRGLEFASSRPTLC